MRVALVIAAALVSVGAQAPDWPNGGGNCLTDADCSYGGFCQDPIDTGTCVCDPWFTGANCDLLNMQAPEDTNVGTCGPAFNSYYSWGGRTVFSGNQYHLYASFMCKHNNLGSWTTVSSSAHFVASDPTGPFQWSSEQCDSEGICTPIIVPWSHNTVITENAAGADPSLLLFHIGNGEVAPSQWAPCFNKSQVPATAPALPELTPEEEEEMFAARTRALTGDAGQVIYLATSSNVNGPWVPTYNNTEVPLNLTGSWVTSLAGNPGPIQSADGSQWFLYFTGTPCPPGWGLAPNCIAMATSDHYDGPYTVVPGPHPIVNMESEDPSVFIDPRGNYHMLTNINTYHRRCGAGVPCGGHSWSADGKTWSNQTLGAFGPVITLANGTVITNAYTERPLVTLNADGTPHALHLGLGRSQYLDSCNWVQLFCTNTSKSCGPMMPAHKTGLFRPVHGGF